MCWTPKISAIFRPFWVFRDFSNINVLIILLLLVILCPSGFYFSADRRRTISETRVLTSECIVKYLTYLSPRPLETTDLCVLASDNSVRKISQLTLRACFWDRKITGFCATVTKQYAIIVNEKEREYRQAFTKKCKFFMETGPRSRTIKKIKSFSVPVFRPAKRKKKVWQ